MISSRTTGGAPHVGKQTKIVNYPTAAETKRPPAPYTPIPETPPEEPRKRRKYHFKPGYQPTEDELWAIIQEEIERKGDDDVRADTVHARLKIYDPLCLNTRKDWESAARDCINLLILER